MARKKVLLVDDVNLIIELEKAFLKGLPVDVLTAGNGAEALEVVQKERPDLIYMDLNMPIMDGLTCCRVLKGNPATSAIPIIMVTTHGREQDLQLCQSAGCDDYITKPINARIFVEKGRNCIADFERRRRRYLYAIDVQFLKDGEPRYGVTADISKGGLYIVVPNDCIPDNPVELMFSLPHEGRSILVAARGRVAWENRDGALKKANYPAGVGIEFTDIDPEIVAVIEQYLEEAKSGKR